MNFKHCLSYVAAALLGASALTSCSEDATLDNAKSVYIDIFPTSFSLCVNDTVPVTATVTNEKGDAIDCPVTWSTDLVDGDTIVKVVEIYAADGSRAYGVTALPGTQSMETKLHAVIPGGKEAVTDVNVVAHNAKGVTAERAVMRVYNQYDTAWFRVDPAKLLIDYEPVITFVNDSLKLAPTDAIVYDDSIPGRVGVRFSAPRISGEGAVIFTIGEELNDASARTRIVMMPTLEVSFYTPGDDSDKRMPPNTLEMYWKVSADLLMDYNTEKELWICVNPIPGYTADIANAKEAYSVRQASESNCAVIRQCVEKDTTGGFDIKLVIGSRATTGNNTFEVVFPDTVLTINVVVEDFQTHPVNDIILDPAGDFELAVGQSKSMTVRLDPDLSFNYWRPVITCDDPDLVEISAYNGNSITVRGLKIGKSNLRFRSNKFEKVVPLNVTEGVTNVYWAQGRMTTLFEGQSTKWSLNVLTTSGAPGKFPISFRSTDESIAVGQYVDGVYDSGVIVAKAPGTTSIMARVLDVETAAEDGVVNVLAVPEGEVTIANDGTDTEIESIGIYDDGADAVFYIPQNAARPDIYIRFLNAPDAYVDLFEWTAAEGNTLISYDGATAEIVSGTFRHAWAEDGESTVTTFSLVVKVGEKTFTIKATGLKGAY